MYDQTGSTDNASYSDPGFRQNSNGGGFNPGGYYSSQSQGFDPNAFNQFKSQFSGFNAKRGGAGGF